MIVGAGIAPHGSLILPASANDGSKAGKIHESMKKLALYIKNLKPDLIFLSTPHGIALETSFGIYRNEKAKGSAEWKDDYDTYSIAIPINNTIANNLFNDLKEKSHKVEGITTYSASEPLPLRWGEVVPLWFIRELETKYVILTQPSRRISQALDMVPELTKLGQDVASFLQALPERVFVLISGDIAHTYQADGPYGIHPTAQPFDDAIGKWATSLETNILVEEAGSKLYTALCCGFTGFVFLDALMKSLNEPKSSEVLCNEHPTYYGMIVANFSW